MTAAIDGQKVATGSDGEFSLGNLPLGGPLILAVPGYESKPLAPGDSGVIELRPTGLVGGVLDAVDGRTIAKARIVIGKRVVESNQEGIYRLADVPQNPTVIVTAPGYARAELRPSKRGRLDIRLQPQPVRAIYVSAATLAANAQREALLQRLGATEINALVLDVKGDRGVLGYASEIPLAAAIGANPIMGPDIRAILAKLKQQNIYTIARIVVYRDTVLAKGRPELTVLDRTTGHPLVDSEGQAWVDPFQPLVADYNVALAEEAAKLGFDEVQFDYLRFPFVRGVDSLSFRVPATAESREGAIADFLRLARQRLQPLGTYLAINVFGYVVWNTDEAGFGLYLETLAPLVDYLSPTLYPSTFGGGLAGMVTGPAAIAAPGEVVRRSMEEAKRRLNDDGVRIRPWLQSFDDYPWQTGHPFGPAEVNAQTRAAIGTGSRGWMLWDPTNRYTASGITPAGSGPAASPSPASGQTSGR